MIWHVGCYVASAFAFAACQSTLLAPVAMLSMAFVMAWNFMPLHECVHRSAFKSRVFNDIFMHVAGVLTLRPVCLESRDSAVQQYTATSTSALQGHVLSAASSA